MIILNGMRVPEGDTSPVPFNDKKYGIGRPENKPYNGIPQYIYECAEGEDGMSFNEVVYNLDELPPAIVYGSLEAVEDAMEVLGQVMCSVAILEDVGFPYSPQDNGRYAQIHKTSEWKDFIEEKRAEDLLELGNIDNYDVTRWYISSIPPEEFFQKHTPRLDGITQQIRDKWAETIKLFSAPPSSDADYLGNYITNSLWRGYHQLDEEELDAIDRAKVEREIALAEV